MRSDKGHLPGVEVDTDEIAHGQDVIAAGAVAAEPYLGTPQIAVAATTLSQETLLAGRTCVDRVGDELLLPTQSGGEVGERRSVPLTVAESVGSLAAFWCAIDAAAIDREGVGAHRTDSERRLAIVTPIVTHGHGAHAPTAGASAGAAAACRTN